MHESSDHVIDLWNVIGRWIKEFRCLNYQYPSKAGGIWPGQDWSAKIKRNKTQNDDSHDKKVQFD